MSRNKQTDNPPALPKVYLIYTPVSTFEGMRAGVFFTNGRGHTTSAAQAEDCKRLGYEVVEQIPSSQKE